MDPTRRRFMALREGWQDELGAMTSSIGRQSVTCECVAA